MTSRECSRVAVLVPAYNAERFVNRAIESLVRGTYPCDVYIVDDGSDIPIASILGAFPRTQVIRLDRNGGVAAARNAGLRAILALPHEFVACLDADDICHPNRIAEQVEYLDCHPEIGAVGTWARNFAEHGGKAIMVQRTPDSAASFAKKMYSNMAIINGSAMMRASALKAIGPYSENYPAAEDYELFRRMCRRYPVANIPNVLMDICISPQGISLSRRRRQLFDRLRIQLKYFEPGVVSAWLGLAKTLALFLVPVAVNSAIKSRFARAADHDRKTGVERDKDAVTDLNDVNMLPVQHEAIKP